MSLIIDGSNGLTFPNSTTQASAGQVLQVVNAYYSTETSVTTNTFTDTNLSASITPKFATSKILVFVSIPVAKQTNDTYAGLRVVRASTPIITFSVETGYTATTATNSGYASTTFLDSPATTSATTYKVQFASNSNNSRVYVFGSGGTGTITLMEIAG